MNVDFRLPKCRDIKVAKYAPQMGLRDRSAGRTDRGPSDASRFARPPTLSVWARHPVKHVLKRRRQRAIVLRGHEQQCVRDSDLRLYALNWLRRILVMILIEDRQIIDAHEFTLKFLRCKFHQRFCKFEVDRLLADAAHDYGNFAGHNDLLAQHVTNQAVWSASAGRRNHQASRRSVRIFGAGHAASAPSFATQRLHDRCRESPGKAWVGRSYEVVVDYDWRVLHPGCAGGFSVRLHDQFGIRRAVIESGHAAASNDLRAGCQHRPSADASDNSASSADVLHELGYARIFGKKGRAFCTTWNENAHIVLGPSFRYRTIDIQQAGSREIAVNLDGLLTRGHHLDLVASLIEGDLGKEVLLLLKRVSDESGNLWACVVHSFCTLCVSYRVRSTEAEGHRCR